MENYEALQEENEKEKKEQFQLERRINELENNATKIKDPNVPLSKVVSGKEEELKLVKTFESGKERKGDTGKGYYCTESGNSVFEREISISNRWQKGDKRWSERKNCQRLLQKLLEGWFRELSMTIIMVALTELGKGIWEANSNVSFTDIVNMYY